MRLNRLHPPELIGPPANVFNLLLLGQRFADTAEFRHVVYRCWTAISNTAPFSSFGGPGSRLEIAVHYEQGAGVDLQLQTSGPKMSIPPAAGGTLSAHLSTLEIESDDGLMARADRIWPRFGRTGRTGCLIAVLVKGTVQAELYELRGQDPYFTPIVGVVVTGEHWPQVVVRGLAQRLGGLADEYELAGPEYASSPETTYLGPNVLILSPGERSDLQSGKPFGTAVHNPPVQWVVADNEAVPFHPHTSPQANPPLPPPDYAAGRLRAVEGGGGYRTNVVRSDFDCLMRRIPYSSQLPIQDDIELCEICRKVLSHVVRGDPDQSLSRRPTLQTHAVLYDRITWRTPPTAVDTASAGAATTVTTDLLPRPDSPAGRPGRWSVAYRATPAGGLEFSDLRLIDRPGDVFAHATNVLKSVSFTNLAAVFPNLPDVVLSYDQAFANTAHPPKLEIARDGGLGEQYRIGVRLQLTWDLPGKCVIEGTFCLVLRDIRNDFDPGGAAMACKFYPQMSLRYRRASQDAPFMAPSQFKATVSMVANNVIPPPPNLSQLPHELRHMNWDQQSVTLATDSNSTDLPDDNVYEPVPGSVNLRWQSGRMLSGVDTDPVAGLPGSFARLAHLVGGQPGLPHWSWLFNYVTWLEAGKSRTFTAVYADREENGLGERRLQVPWPVAEDQDGGPENYVMTVIKSPRQGAYDSVHVNAHMGAHDGRAIIPAPFCADVCMHLHWRWGTVATSGANDKQAFLGWGDGSPGGGANTTLGGPLIPPNQHLDITIDRLASGSETRVDYAVTAYGPGRGQHQVVLEQGLGMAFSYGGLPRHLLAALTGGLGFASDVPTALTGDELSVRALFHKIYQRIRLYDPSVDDVTAARDVPQLPGDPGRASTPSDLAQLEAL